MILIEDAHGVVHVAKPSTDAVHWTRCGDLFNADAVDPVPRAKDGSSFVARQGRYVDRAPTCLWCVQERQRIAFKIDLGIGNVSSISKMDFVTEDTL